MILYLLAFSYMNVCGTWPTRAPLLDTGTLHVRESVSFTDFSERENTLAFDGSLTLRLESTVCECDFDSGALSRRSVLQCGVLNASA
jgi:hypothetical protein